MEISNSKVPAKFVRVSLNYQAILALKLSKGLSQNVYVYDKIGYFADAEIKVFDSVRYSYKQGKYAVLSVAAQEAFRTANTYRQYSNMSLSEDTTGLYIEINTDNKV